MSFQTIVCRHKGGGTLSFSYRGVMRRMEEGDIGPVPIPVYERNVDKLTPVGDTGRDVPALDRLTTQMSKDQTRGPERPKWPLKVDPGFYLERYGPTARYSELAREILES